jgi:hypothetical protein
MGQRMKTTKYTGVVRDRRTLLACISRRVQVPRKQCYGVILRLPLHIYCVKNNEGFTSDQVAEVCGELAEDPVEKRACANDKKRKDFDAHIFYNLPPTKLK